MRVVLALALVAMGGLAAYVSGPGGVHAQGDRSVIAGQMVAGAEVAGPEVTDPELPDPELPDPELPDPELPGPEVAGSEVAGDEALVAPVPRVPGTALVVDNGANAVVSAEASVQRVPGEGEGEGEVVAAEARITAVAPRPLNLRIIMSGHSLTDPMGSALPPLVQAAGGIGGRIALSTIPGAPMDVRWNDRRPSPDARTDIAEFDVLVQTERVSLSGTRYWHKSDDEALRWARHAWENGADGQGAEVLLYATWVSLDTGPGFATHGDEDSSLPWRTRLDREFTSWEEIMAHVNAHRPGDAPQMRMIPATLVMAAIYDAIDAGAAPEGLRDIRQLFSDDIHLSPLGAWLVALTHYAVIYARDPRGLPGPQGASPELVEWAQALVWEVVTGYPGTGVRGD